MNSFQTESAPVYRRPRGGKRSELADTKHHRADGKADRPSAYHAADADLSAHHPLPDSLRKYDLLGRSLLWIGEAAAAGERLLCSGRMCTCGHWSHNLLVLFRCFDMENIFWF